MVFECKKCDKQWYYPVEKCIFCRGNVKEVVMKQNTVRAVTEVCVPSPGHMKVPYRDLLLEDEHGNFHIRKVFTEHKLGDVIQEAVREEGRKVAQRTIGVVGAGTMGSGIAQVCAQVGYSVILSDIKEEFVDKAMARIDKRLAKVTKEEEKNEILARIKTTVSLADMADAELVEEVALEKMDVKKQVFKELEDVCSEKAAFATNTSSLSIGEIAKELKDPGRLVGLHFFNPVPVMQLVEIIKAETTRDDVVEYAREVSSELGKTPVVTGDRPGFIVNRLLLPFLNESIDKLADGTSTAEDIDKAVKLGLNHPMGPLALADLIGLDVCKAILDVLFDGYKDPKYKPCDLLCKMTDEGNLGRKTGKGFHNYGQ